MNSRELYLRLISHLRPYRREFAVGILFMVLLALTEPAIPYFLKPLLDGTFVERDPQFLFWSPIVLVVLFLVRGSCNLVSQIAFAWVSGKLVFDLRQLMFERVLTLPTSYYDAHATGMIITKITHNVTQVTVAVTKVLMILVRDTVIVTGLIAYMLYLNWQFSLLVFVLLPVLALTVRLIARRLRRLSRSNQAAMGEITHVVGEASSSSDLGSTDSPDSSQAERYRTD